MKGLPLRLSLLFLLCILVFILSLVVGPTGLPADSLILWQIRLPRSLLGFLAGSSLGIAGASLQGLLMNPLADPYILGMSGGAALGAVVSILFGLEKIAHGAGVPLTACLGAFLSLFLVIALARRDKTIPVETIILAGVVVGAFLWSLVTLLLSFSGEDAYRILLWLMGSLSNAEWRSVKLALFPSLLGSVALLFFWRELDVLGLGEEVAGYLGVQTDKAKLLIIIFASVAVAGAVSTCGIIGFVGLISPHIGRALFGYNHRVLLPASYLLGGILLLFSDTIAKTIIAPGELPVGAITALLGAPFFAYLLHKRKSSF
ncbi:iron ABC transporter permease [bacterium]|nr:iron ABC transporter permease [bacterium]